MATLSPFADSFRKDLSSAQSRNDSNFMGGLGSMLQKYREQLGGGQASQPRPANPFLNQLSVARRNDESEDQYNIRSGLTRTPQTPAQPANPFEGNEQYQALMEYQKSMAPSQEQQDRLKELSTAFENTGGYKDYRISQMEQQMQRMRQQPRMGMGLGGMRPTGMGMFGGFPQQPQRQFGQMPMRQPMVTPRGGFAQYNQMNQPKFMQQPNPNNYGGYGMQQAPQQQYQMPQPQYQPYQNPYQQAQPQPQQFGGYGMGQSMGGYGGYGGMSNPYQPQQFGQQSMSQPQQFASYMR